MLCMGCMYILQISWENTQPVGTSYIYPTKCTLLTRKSVLLFNLQLEFQTRNQWAISLTWETSSNQSTHLSSYDYIITLNRRGKSHDLLFENWMVAICKDLNPLHPWMFCAKFGWNYPSGSVVLDSGEEDFKFRWCIFAISEKWTNVYACCSSELIINNECLVYIHSLDTPIITYVIKIGQFHIS